MRLVNARNDAVRTVSFEFINQQLFYDGFAEMLMVVLPLVDRDALWRLGVKGFRLLNAVLFAIKAKWKIAMRRRARQKERAERRKQLRSSRSGAGGRRNKKTTSLSEEGECCDDDDDTESEEDEEDLDSSEDEAVADVAGRRLQEAAKEKSLACVFCGADPATNPLRTDCGQCYCYFWLKTQCMRDKDFECSDCQSRVQSSAFVKVVNVVL